MTKRKYYQTLKFWIWIIIFILLLSNIGISVLKPDWNTKIGLFISLNASLLGGLCTLISVSITNEYYNREKIKELRTQEIREVEKQVRLLQFLLDEFKENNAKQIEYNKNKDGMKIFVFQSVVWDEYRKEFTKLFMENSVKNLLPRLQYFYSQLKLYEYVLNSSSVRIFNNNLDELTEDIIAVHEVYESLKNEKIRLEYDEYKFLYNK